MRWDKLDRQLIQLAWAVPWFVHEKKVGKFAKATNGLQNCGRRVEEDLEISS